MVQNEDRPWVARAAFSMEIKMALARFLVEFASVWSTRQILPNGSLKHTVCLTFGATSVHTSINIKTSSSD